MKTIATRHATLVGGKEKKSPFRSLRRERERDQRVLSQGAEAEIILVAPRSKKSSSLTTSKRSASTKSGAEQFIIKKRVKKSYRIKELDDKIRKRRTKSETKLLKKASKIVNVPKITKTDEKTKIIEMEYIDGKKLSDYLDKFPLTKQKLIMKQLGQDIAKLHDVEIIHGDLTTSNLILKDVKSNLNQQEAIQDSQNNAKKGGFDKGKLGSLYFIDFGLGFISRKYEDKAVDIHLIKQALEAKHFKNWEVLFKELLKGYNKSKSSKTVLERLKAVEKRRRYKH